MLVEMTINIIIILQKWFLRRRVSDEATPVMCILIEADVWFFKKPTLI
jgi:hypothetical protein